MIRKLGLTFLFLISISILPDNIQAQESDNRTKKIYHYGEVIYSDRPINNKVAAALKNKIMILTSFYILDEKGGKYRYPFSSQGTGVVKDIGLIVTSRHLIFGDIEDEIKKWAKQKNIALKSLEYNIKGVIFNEDSWQEFQLILFAVEKPDSFKDVMVLKVNPKVIQEAISFEGSPRVNSMGIRMKNPYAILLSHIDFGEAKLGDKVFITGLKTVFAPFSEKFILIDLIDFTFHAEVSAEIIDMPVNTFGTKKLYRLRDSAESGFSGGMVLNNQGQLVGITIAMAESKNFVYAISSEDIKGFFKDHDIK